MRTLEKPDSPILVGYQLSTTTYVHTWHSKAKHPLQYAVSKLKEITSGWR
jgi:hypothetical protein